MKKWCVRVVGLSAGVVLLWFLLAVILPFPHERLHPPPGNTRLLDSEGGLLRRTLSTEGEDRDWIRLSETGPWSAPALIAVEDKRFYQHTGMDPIAVLRAMKQNVGSRRIVSGASTISSQVIRMLDPDRERTLYTKGVEFFRATQMELRYEKSFILEQYLNRAPMGGNRYGISVGARRYYGKEPSMLSVGEASLLMGLPQSPSRYRPNTYPERAEKRRETVLRRMREEGMLAEEVLLETGTRWVPPPMKAFHFTEWVRRRHGHLKGEIDTTLDPGIQSACKEIVRRSRMKGRYAQTDGIGVIILDAQTGSILGWVGGWDAENPMISQVDTVTRKRAPGSTLKPFAFALGMQRGWLTPETRLEDRPRSYRDYQPSNMEASWSGDVTARDALVRSLNFPALQVVEQTGVREFLSFIRSCGPSLEGVNAAEVGIGAVLGGGMELSLLEVASAYTVFATGGSPRMVAARQHTEERPAPVLAPGVAYWINEMLSGEERDRMLFGHVADVERPPLAFKTGTSHGHRDAWAIGWNGDWVIGVWVGRLDGGSVEGLSGAAHAAPLLGQIAMEMMPTTVWPSPTTDLVQVQGHELLRGITDPAVMTQKNRTTPSVILSPRPDFTWKGLEKDTLTLPLKANAPLGSAIHWFVNGDWVGKSGPEESIPFSFAQGTHTVRAVFPDGQAETRTVTILSFERTREIAKNP